MIDRKDWNNLFQRKIKQNNNYREGFRFKMKSVHFFRTIRKMIVRYYLYFEGYNGYSVSHTILQTPGIENNYCQSMCVKSIQNSMTVHHKMQTIYFSRQSQLENQKKLIYLDQSRLYT